MLTLAWILAMVVLLPGITLGVGEEGINAAAHEVAAILGGGITLIARRLFKGLVPRTE